MILAEIVGGKSVVIIAPGAYLAGSKQRSKIESHDIVCRINRGFPVPPNMVEDISDRCDVLFHLLAVGMAANEKEFAPLVGHVGYIVSTHHQGEPRIARFKTVNRGRIPFECVPFSTIQRVKLRVKKAPNAGLIAVTHLLNQPIKSLYLTGFSFYEDGYYVGYGGRDARASAAMRGGQAGHDQITAKAYMKDLLSATTVPVEVDETMKRILDRALSIRRQIEEIHGLKNQALVTLKATMAQRFGAETIMPGDTMVRVKSEADILIRKGRAILI